MGCGVEEVDAREHSAGHRSCAPIHDSVEHAWCSPRGERGFGSLVELRRRIGTEDKLRRRGPRRRRAETSDDADGVSEQIAHDPLRARCRVVVLIGADVADHAVCMLKRSLEVCRQRTSTIVVEFVSDDEITRLAALTVFAWAGLPQRPVFVLSLSRTFEDHVTRLRSLASTR